MKNTTDCAVVISISTFFHLFTFLDMQEELEANQQRGKKRKKRKWKTEEEEEEERRWWSWIGGKAIFLALICALVAVIVWLGYERL